MAKVHFLNKKDRILLRASTELDGDAKETSETGWLLTPAFVTAGPNCRAV